MTYSDLYDMIIFGVYNPYQAYHLFSKETMLFFISA